MVDNKDADGSNRIINFSKNFGFNSIVSTDNNNNKSGLQFDSQVYDNKKNNSGYQVLGNKNAIVESGLIEEIIPKKDEYKVLGNKNAIVESGIIEDSKPNDDGYKFLGKGNQLDSQCFFESSGPNEIQNYYSENVNNTKIAYTRETVLKKNPGSSLGINLESQNTFNTFGNSMQESMLNNQLAKKVPKTTETKKPRKNSNYATEHFLTEQLANQFFSSNFSNKYSGIQTEPNVSSYRAGNELPRDTFPV